MLALQKLPRLDRLLLAFWFGLLAGGHFVSGHIPTVSRLGSSALLVALAWRAHQRKPNPSFSFFIATGVTFGFVGDIALADWGLAGSYALLSGIFFFAVGHLFYIRAALAKGFADRRLALAWGAWLVVGGMSWQTGVGAGLPLSVPMQAATLIYTLLLASTSGVTAALAWQRVGYQRFSAGGALFLASDVLFAMHEFNPKLFAMIPVAWQGDIGWLVYASAQALIVSALF